MIQIRSDFPGGNIRVLSVEGREVQLAPDLRDTEGPWFYWYFAARFSEPGRWHFSFPDGPAVGPRGAAFSCDGGLSWQFTDRIGAGDREFFYENDGSVPEVRFAMAPPYGLGELERFLAVTPGIMRGELCRSRGGLPVELLTVPGAADCRVLITARHHCCEMSANRVMEGILRQWCAGDQTGCELRRRATLLAVPFADRDGVEAGDQGKNRRPHDHARDYGHPGGAHLYPECAALDRLLETRSTRIVVDLHCPWLRGGSNEKIHFVGPEKERMARKMALWSEWLPALLPGDVPFDPADNVPFGTSWNTGANYTQGQHLVRHSADFDWIDTALSIEIPFVNAGEVPLGPSQFQNLGKALAEVMLRELRRLQSGR